MTSSQEYYDNLETCSICLQKCGLRKGLVTPCGHIYHINCLHQWTSRNNSCPICREPIFEVEEEPNNTEHANLGINVNFATRELDITLDRFRKILSITLLFYSIITVISLFRVN